MDRDNRWERVQKGFDLFVSGLRESFPELVNELATNSTQPKAQDLSQRSYFGKFDRPDANGLLR